MGSRTTPLINQTLDEALAYNGLAQSWPEIMRLSHEEIRPEIEQGGLFK